jgi:lipopolysaccharide heptosyltransferase II
MGDVLMTTPALRALKEANARRRLTLLTSRGGAEVAPLVPEIDDVIAYDPPWMKATHYCSRAGDEALIARLRRLRFDGAVIFTVYSQSALPAAMLCHLADIPLRLAHCRENPYSLLTDWLPEREPEECLRHEVVRQLDLVAAIGCQTQHRRLSFQVPQTATRRVLERIGSEAGSAHGRPVVVVHPGASAASRRYPAEQFARAARLVAERTACRMVLTGSAEEAPLVEGIRSYVQHGAVSLAGQLSLAELGALIALARLLISNNTGPAHIAAAVGTPVVDLYALTNPQHTPWQVPSRVLNHDVPCKYCYKSVCPQGHHDCLRRVEPEAVCRAARELLGESMTHSRPARRTPSLPVPSALPSMGG